MTALACVYGVVLLLGLPLNATALWVLLRRHGLKSSTATLMINLATSDLLLAVSLPLRVHYYATRGRWPWSRGLCAACTLLLRNNVRTSSVFITLLSLDRLLALVLPLRSRALRSPPRTLATCAAVWLLVCVLTGPEAAQLYHVLPEGKCFEVRGGSPVVNFVQSGVVFSLLGANLVSTSLVAHVLWLRGSATATERRRRLRCLLLFCANLMVFAVFFMPLSVTLLMVGRGGCSPQTLHIIVCLTSVNCCLDPPLYYFCLDGFWHSERLTTTDTDAGLTLRDTDCHPPPASPPCTAPLD